MRLEGQDQSQGAWPNRDRNASNRLRRSAGPEGSAWERTPEPVLRDKNQVKTGKNMANQRKTMSGPT